MNRQVADHSAAFGPRHRLSADARAARGSLALFGRHLAGHTLHVT